ncbi:MAG: hypothetical protein EAZ42_07185 [Verrucomicrobia bacterium]|nr:MAG: hypothetical protein EAZ42_07185 [Verrucomicrobiota bacterium]
MRRAYYATVGMLWLLLAPWLAAEGEDTGRQEVSNVRVTVFYATNGDPKQAGQKARALTEDQEASLREQPQLEFEHYRWMGEDMQPVLRSYENWAQPLKPSDEILLKFEAGSLPTAGAIKLDLELWLSRKKVLKTHSPLSEERPLFVLGPEWRGGRLIISVALASGT